MKETKLQQLIDRQKPGQSLILDPPNQEFGGAIVLRRPLVLQGQGATIRHTKGPVVCVKSSGVILRDLNIEVTGDAKKLGGQEACALAVQRGIEATSKNVCLRGDVSGVSEEEGRWFYPRSIRLGSLAPQRQHEFKLRVALPVRCSLTCDIDGVTVKPRTCTGGNSVEITLHLEAIKGGIRLRGDVLIQTASFVRQITVSGNVAEAGAGHPTNGDGQLIYDWEDPHARSSCSAAKPVRAPSERQAPAPPEPEAEPDSDIVGGAGGAPLPPPPTEGEVDRPVKPPAEKAGEVGPVERQPSRRSKKIRSTPVPASDAWSPAAAAKPADRPGPAPPSPEVRPQPSGDEPSPPGTKETAKAVTRRLPVYLLIDCSRSMRGDPIDAVRRGLRAMLTDLQGDPLALESVNFGVIRFGIAAEQLIPLTPIEHVSAPTLNVDAKDGRTLGDALVLLRDCLLREVRWPTSGSKGDWLPLVLLFINGPPSDEWEKAAEKLRHSGLARIMVISLGPEADDSYLKQLSDTVVHQRDVSPETLRSFFKWVTVSMDSFTKRPPSTRVKSTGLTPVWSPSVQPGKSEEETPASTPGTQPSDGVGEGAVETASASSDVGTSADTVAVPKDTPQEDPRTASKRLRAAMPASGAFAAAPAPSAQEQGPTPPTSSKQAPEESEQTEPNEPKKQERPKKKIVKTTDVGFFGGNPANGEPGR